MEFAVLVRNPRTGEPQPHILSPEEIDSVLKRQKLAKFDENATGDTMGVDA